MTKHLEQVKEFHKIFGHPILPIKEEISHNRAKLRISLLFEELSELAQAYGVFNHFTTLCGDELQTGVIKEKRNRVEQLDALADLQYVLNGAVLESGFETIWEEACSEVHRSNMTKICNVQEAARIVNNYALKHIDITMKQVGENQYILYRAYDNKTIKPDTYSPANLEELITKGEHGEGGISVL